MSAVTEAITEALEQKRHIRAHWAECLTRWSHSEYATKDINSKLAVLDNDIKELEDSL